VVGEGEGGRGHDGSPIFRSPPNQLGADSTTQGSAPTIGGEFDFYLKPLVKLKHVTEFDLDDAKTRLLQLSVGFRYVPSPDKPHVERMIVAFTTNFPLGGGFLLSDRNRADLDWEKGAFTWRYRNRLNLERTIIVGSYHPSPYVAVETLLSEPISKMEHHCALCGLYSPISQALST